MYQKYPSKSITTTQKSLILLFHNKNNNVFLFLYSSPASLKPRIIYSASDPPTFNNHKARLSFNINTKHKHMIRSLCFM